MSRERLISIFDFPIHISRKKKKISANFSMSLKHRTDHYSEDYTLELKKTLPFSI